MVSGEVLPMADYEKKGAQRLQAHRQAVDKKTPDTEVSTDVNALNPRSKFLDIFNPNMPKGLSPYRTETKELPKSATETFPELKAFTKDDLGFDLPQTKLKETQILNHDDRPGTGLPIVKGTHSTDGKFMIHQDAFKKYDRSASDGDKSTATQPQRRVPANEMSYQAYKSVAGDNTKNMQAQFLMNIYNPGMWRIIQESYKDRGIGLNTRRRGRPRANPPPSTALLVVITPTGRYWLCRTTTTQWVISSWIKLSPFPSMLRAHRES